MIGAVEASSTDIYEAVIALSRSIAGRTDLRSLLSGVGESLRRIVRFDHIGMSLYDPNGNVMQKHILEAPGSAVITSLRLPIHEDPAGWVWMNQQPLVISTFSRKLAGRRPYDSLATSGSVQRCSSPSLPVITGSARSALAP